MPFSSEKTDSKLVKINLVTEAVLNNYLRGIKTSKTAFSCTCHPKRKDVHPDNVSAVRNDL